MVKIQTRVLWMENETMNKKQLRSKLIKQRKLLSKETWRTKSDRICYHLQSLPLFTQAKTILAYCSFCQEPDLTPLFNSNKTWGLPRCVGKSLVWHLWQPGDILQEDKYGILSPDPDSPQIGAQDVDLILVPTVACDRHFYRLGYGGGFYDRLLSSPQWENKPTIGIVFEFAFVEQLPVDDWDQPLGGICTEEGVKEKG